MLESKPHSVASKRKEPCYHVSICLLYSMVKQDWTGIPSLKVTEIPHSFLLTLSKITT